MAQISIDSVELMQMYNENLLSLDQIAEHFKCSAATVKKHLRLIGVTGEMCRQRSHTVQENKRRNGGPVADSNHYCSVNRVAFESAEYKLALKYDGRRLRSLTEDEMAELWEEHFWSDERIAALFKCSRSAVTTVRNALGVVNFTTALGRNPEIAKLLIARRDPF